MRRERLDQFALDIEFLLISVVQGVALAALSASAVPILVSFKLEFFVYIFSAFLLILMFWSGAILHALSFIDWPLNMWHNFLYFLVSFVEVMAFSQVSNPLAWFSFILVFFVITAVLYLVDLWLIEEHEEEFSNTQARKNLFHHIIKEQRFELKYLITLGIAVSLLAVYFIYRNPKVHLYFGVLLEVLLSLFLLKFIKTYKKRVKLISLCLKKS